VSWKVLVWMAAIGVLIFLGHVSYLFSGLVMDWMGF